jgi:transposase
LQYQPGEMDYSRRIFKRGDGAMRRFPFEAATVLITRVRRFSPLKAWRRFPGGQSSRPLRLWAH